MTAEVAVLNTSAVAMAADSAATIDVDRSKVFRTANKLFMLSKHEPVGVMVYGGADINSMPWETVIKAFRADLGTTALDTLPDYSDMFFDWLTAHTKLFPSDERTKTFLRALTLWLVNLREAVDRAIEYFEQISTTNGGSLITAAEAAAMAVEQALQNVKASPLVEGVPSTAAATANKEYRVAVDGLIARTLKPELVTPAMRRKLRTLPGLLATRAHEPAALSGIVIAGFGRQEHLPSLREFSVYGVHEKFVKRQTRKALSISPTGAAIVPFAQMEMVATFLDGVGPGLRDVLERTAEEFSESLPDRIEEAIGSALSVDSRSKAERIGADLVAELSQKMDWMSTKHSNPIVNTVSVLPKDELAAMAESLVNLTRFKRRISLNEVETVAGDIDVAVISKGDGFVWIKRKHYFDLDRNPHWRAHYYDDAGSDS